MFNNPLEELISKVFFRLYQILFVLNCFHSLSFAEVGGVEASVLNKSQQIVFVLSKNWYENSAWLYRFEKEKSETGKIDAWKAVGNSIPVSLGYRGLAWGVGLHKLQTNFVGPIIDEMDTRSPAGIFPITTAFGRRTSTSFSDLKIPYHQTSNDDLCIDDPKSQFYNRIVSKSKINVIDWQSSEPLIEYNLAIIYDQNPQPSLSRKGSCYFLHPGPSSGGNNGCTTMEEASFLSLMNWLDQTKSPLLVQLPYPMYVQLKREWGLPNLKIKKDGTPISQE